jgi:hypothetical protein
MITPWPIACTAHTINTFSPEGNMPNGNHGRVNMPSSVKIGLEKLVNTVAGN